MQQYGNDYRFRAPYAPPRTRRRYGGELRPGYDRGYHARRRAGAARYDEEYSPAYRQLFGGPYDEWESGIEWGYRELMGQTPRPGIGEGSIGGARFLGTGGGFFHR